MNMYKISAETTFSAAHRLEGYDGNCQRVHGHNWKIIAQVMTDQVNELGIAYDFRELSRKLNDLIAPFDHQILNDVPPFGKLNPTSENIARHIYHALKGTLPGHIHVVSVEVKESDKYSAVYSEE